MHSALFSGSYDLGLVALSILIAVCASYAALELAGCTAISHGRAKVTWTTCGAVAMGLGIWGMHYIGMLAFKLPVTVLYDVPLVVLSLFAAILSSAVALYVVSRPTVRAIHFSVGAAVMGSGVFAMHYIGMAAMRLPARSSYNFKIVALSALIAVVVSGAALLITYKLRRDVGTFRWLRLGSAGVMGAGIAAMHYTAMTAVCFEHMAQVRGTGHAVSVSSIATGAIIYVTLFVLVLAIAGVLASRYVARKNEVLQTTQAEFRMLLDHSVSWICRTTLQGIVVDTNEIAALSFGYKNRQDFIGVNVGDHYVDPADRLRNMSQLKRSGFVNGAEVRMKRTDGQILWILYNLVLVKGLNSSTPEVITTASDITEIKRTQEDLRIAKEAAEAADRAKGQFLANMGHELRTPLNGILGMTALALHSEISEEVRGYLEDAHTSAEALLRIINDVLAFSAIEQRSTELDKGMFSPRVLVGAVVQTSLTAAAAKGIHLRAECEKSLCEQLAGDGTSLSYVIGHLVENAIKFTETGGVSIKASTAVLDGGITTLHIQVCDTGIGVAPDKLNSIFHPFVQADVSDSRRFGGTGLGLAICSRLVANLGGKLWAESEVGVGSTFQLLVEFETVDTLDKAIEEQRSSQWRAEGQGVVEVPATP